MLGRTKQIEKNKALIGHLEEVDTLYIFKHTHLDPLMIL